MKVLWVHCALMRRGDENDPDYEGDNGLKAGQQWGLPHLQLYSSCFTTLKCFSYFWKERQLIFDLKPHTLKYL